ncbi:T9SS type A sorting domain-containing protein [Formosa sediminum]|uniref:T9SS type A sorting domain-containing protein n=1 Tax=Formosa sediminum TaxID=2594004 RepID=A0A516GVH0_9FLAO|nr:fibronectin type III domain-containing protein [Formosa sediminum]QDO95512.1 T9SS type A sorting domain-containing protein [Formosa sediminum]
MKQKLRVPRHMRKLLKCFITGLMFSVTFISQVNAQSNLVPSDLLNAWNSNTENNTTYAHCEQWKITYPTSDEDKTLCGEDNNEFFYVNSSNDGIVFYAPIRSDNGTTPNSSNIRSELREREIDGGSDKYWTTEGRHVIYVKQAITHLPINVNKLVATQIHGNKSDGIDDALVVRLEGKHLFLNFNGGVLRSNVTITNNYELGTLHEVIFEVLDDKHYVYYSEDGNLKAAYQNGTASSYLVKDNGNAVLMDIEYDDAYFKVGNYTQSNPSKEGDDTDDPDNYGEVVVYDMYVDHADEPVITPINCNASAPTGLTVTNVSKTEATLSWNFNTTVDHYNVRYREVGNSTWITKSSITAGSVTLTGLNEDAEYEWQIRAKCADETGSNYSDAQGSNFTTTETETSCNATAPTGLTVTNVSKTEATLSWNFNTTIDHYNVRYREVGNSTWITKSSIRTGSVTLTSLNEDAEYEWQIRAKCADENGSNYLDAPGPNFETTSSPSSTTCSDTPTGLYVSNLTNNSATLNWDYNSSVNHYNVRYKKTGDSDWRYIESIKTGNVMLTDVNTSSSYEWQIRAKCEDGSGSDYNDGQGPDFLPTSSNQNTVVQSCSDTPTGLYVSNLTSNSVTLNWDYSSSVNHYNVRYKKTGDSDWRYVESIKTGNVTLTDVNTSSSYEWQIRAKCEDGNGSDYNDGQGPDFLPTSSNISSQSSIVAYTNSSKTNLIVKIDDNTNTTADQSIKIFNIYGRLVYEKSNINSSDSQILNDISIEDGIYVIMLFNKNGEIIESKKVMKN